MTLDMLNAGESGVNTAVAGEGLLLFRIMQMGLIPQPRITVSKIAPMGDPMELQLRGYVLTLRREDARSIEIKKAEP